ncbi:tRNA (adenosine(37)-N6)-dimethylallyltransferase MiaA [soil metagenome]
MTYPPVVVLGPTASGKSDVAMVVARQVAGVEIIAVDAMQVYRRMDIGTAKPTVADRTAVPHHGLDLADPGRDFTVHDYRRAYDAALVDIAGRRAGHPLLVAGTGLYLTAVLDRLELPGRWPDVRADIDAEPAMARLHRRLAELDPLAARRIEPTNRRRVVRALEVTIGGGRPFSSFGPGVAAFPPISTVQIGLRWPRPALAARIERRVHDMVSSGLLDEVRALRQAGMSATASQALGYKELGDHLGGRATLDEAVATIVTRTRQFAVRQERWFRRDPRVRWTDIDPDAPDPLHDARAAVLEALGQ